MTGCGSPRIRSLCACLRPTRELSMRDRQRARVPRKGESEAPQSTASWVMGEAPRGDDTEHACSDAAGAGDKVKVDPDAAGVGPAASEPVSKCGEAGSPSFPGGTAMTATALLDENELQPEAEDEATRVLRWR